MATMSLPEARRLLGWTQQRLANESGCRLSTIASIECGGTKKPSFVTVMALVKAMQRGGLAGVSAEDIFSADKVA